MLTYYLNTYPEQEIVSESKKNVQDDLIKPPNCWIQRSETHKEERS